MTSIQAFALAARKAAGAVSGVQTMSVSGQTLNIDCKDGTKLHMTFPTPQDGQDGVSVTNASIDANMHLILTLSDGTSVDAGEIPGAEVTYSNPGVKEGVGGIKKGEVFNDVPIQQVIDKLLQPAYTKPSVKVTFDCNALNDPTKTTLSQIKATATITKGTEDILWCKVYINDVLAQTFNNPAGSALVYTYAPGTQIKETVKIKAVVCDKDTQSEVSNETKVEFFPGCHYGCLEDAVEINPTTVGTLTYKLKNKIADTFEYTATYGRFIFAYPKEMGMWASAKDLVNNFTYTSSCDTMEIMLNGYPYYVAYLKDSSGFTDLPITWA